MQTPYFFSGLIIETVIWFFCFRSSLANFWISFAVIQTADSTVCKELLYASKGQLCNAKGLLYDS